MSALKNLSFQVSQGKEFPVESLSLEVFESRMGISFSPSLHFAKSSVEEKLRKKIEKLHRKGGLSRQQLWFGSYFKKEIEEGFLSDVVIRYIDPVFGYGVFANRDFKKMEFIAVYSGVVRKYARRDRENPYCFEYTLANGLKTPYTIDAQDVGGIGRYVNHSDHPNLLSALATIDFINYVILITSCPIPKGTQLCYDYGPDYWGKREKPQPLA